MKKLLIAICLFVIGFTAKSQDYVITQLGVSADSTKLNTQAIQKVIDKAHGSGGGTIVIPKGVFLTGALFFKPNTKLRLLEGAVLKGSDNISDYPLIPSRMEGRSLLYYAALINAYYVDSFSITGPGMINGNGNRFWSTFWAYRDSMRKIGKEATNLEIHRPRLLFIWGCNQVHLQNVKLRNSGFWTTHLYQCQNVLIENCDIRSPYRPVPAPSTDGIDIDVCKKVIVRNCYISVNDDAVCIKGGKGPDAHKRSENGVVEDILVENCTFGEAHGTLTIGSESIHARNITLRNCKVENNCPILRLKMRPDTYQTYENITIDNVSGKCGSIINLNPWKQFFNMGGSSEKPYATVRNITISNIKVECKNFGDIEGNPSDSVYNIVFKDINATSEAPILKNKYQDIKAENVIVNGMPLVIK
ncbi:glycosyl hydrolase family 28 protein [Chitinophagaceae bacterium LB-8]|uniref:Glycosyl hydrolase family 28 protein n=1 Tax=Paraflavisolibacter caeni TaxID=2982496 RepID=A0A9X2Y1H4_9BACT|nr:glycosyl hydrolase family 28 protein [Paraflavisolibacter caeni]MCU7552827.1 glycosyl hydrolase family 28 protein [Paraflavisolibacter caeni]